MCDKVRFKCPSWPFPTVQLFTSFWFAAHPVLPEQWGLCSNKAFSRVRRKKSSFTLLPSAVSWDLLKQTGNPAPTVCTATGPALPDCSAGSQCLQSQPCLSWHISIRQHGKLVIFIYCLQFMAASILPPAHLKRKGKKSTPILSKCLYSRSVCFRKGGRDVGIFIVCERSLGGLQLEK